MDAEIYNDGVVLKLGDCKTLALPFKFVFEVALPPQKLDFGEQSEPSRRPNERSVCDQRESLVLENAVLQSTIVVYKFSAKVL